MAGKPLQPSKKPTYRQTPITRGKAGRLELTIDYNIGWNVKIEVRRPTVLPTMQSYSLLLGHQFW